MSKPTQTYRMAKLSDVADISPTKQSPSLPPNTLFHFIPMKAVMEEFGGIDIQTMRPLYEVSKGYTQFMTGDVIIAKITPCMENGKLAIVPDLKSPWAYGSTEFHVIRPNAEIESKWIAHFLSQMSCRRDARNKMSGSAGQLRVPTAWLEAVALPIPAIIEQRRIIAKIEELFSDLDAGVAALERVRANLKRYRAAVLNAAVTGRLTETWRKRHDVSESANDVLDRSLANKQVQWELTQVQKYTEIGKRLPKNWKSRYAPPPSPQGEELTALPRGWCWASVEQLGATGEQAVLTGPFGSTLGREDFINSGVPLLTIGCLTEIGIKLDKACFVTPTKAEELARYRIGEGDLLFSRSASVGRVGLVSADLNGSLINYHLMRLRLDKNLISPMFFVFYVRGSRFVVAYLRRVNHGATRDGINTNDLLAMPVALPPVSEQAQIMREVEQRLSIVEAVEVEIERALRRAARLRQAILKRAFEGKLVPQDPQDVGVTNSMREPKTRSMKRFKSTLKV